ncbi:MAG: beta-lactamase family protein [Lachnospiraceae bacterium]|nr:beta-lactamase family protein [Lachnospiraceae bacterium]
MSMFHSVDANGILKVKGIGKYGVSAAVTKGENTEVYCSGSGRYGRDFPVNPDMLFQAGSVSKPVFALTLLRYVDKGIIDLDADLSGVLSDYIKIPMTFSALLSHTAGFNLHGFPGYRADAPELSLEDVLSGKGNTPKLRRIRPYGKQYRYSGGGITLAELAFTRITGLSLPDAFVKEVAEPLGLTGSGYFQPLDGDRVSNAAFGGKLGIKEDPNRGFHYYPERAAAGFWTTPTELNIVGIALGRSYREGGILNKKTAERMMTPIKDNVGLCIFRGDKNRPELACHGGWNEGFLTDWRFSLKEDLCTTVMINRTDNPTAKASSEAGSALYEHLLNS